MRFSSFKLILLGVFLMLLGWLFVFMNICGLLPTSYFLSFLSYGMGISGMLFGYLGLFSGLLD